MGISTTLMSAGKTTQWDAFLEYAEDKFLVQVLNKSTRAEVLDLVLSSVEGIIKEVKTESSL